MALKAIQNFASMFTNLTQGQQDELQLAFKDLQDVVDTTSLTTSLELLKRRPNQALPVPVVTSTPTVRGAILEWDALPDQRAGLYEIDVSSTSNFASFITTTTLGLSAVVDGLTTTKYARVRGVRNDETTTPYSDVVAVSPNVFEVATHTDEDFYIRIIGGSENTVLGGLGSDLAYTPINPAGQSMVWGFAAMYADPAVAMYGKDNINVRVYYKVYDEQGNVESDTLMWKNSVSEYFNSYSIGPFTIQHPTLNKTVELRMTIQDNIGTVVDNTQVQWCHLNVFELGVN
jgi:hypothetical protein